MLASLSHKLIYHCILSTKICPNCSQTDKLKGYGAIQKDKEEEMKHKTADKNTQGAPRRRSVKTMLLLESNQL